MLVEWYLTDFVYHFFIGSESPEKHQQKENAEYQEGTNAEYAYATDLFEVINKLHTSIF